MQEFISPKWLDFLTANNAAGFEQLWDRKDPWFEEPNSGRSKNGWSGVCKITLDGKDFFLKKQENFFTYSLKKPMGGSVVEKEFANLQMFNNLDIPSMTVVYFGIRRESGNLQGLIITEALSGYSALADSRTPWKNTLPISSKRKITQAVAQLVKDTHAKGIMHHSLYPKHIFLENSFAQGKQEAQTPLCRFIDLETAKKAKAGSKKQMRDIDTLDRRCDFVSKTDRLYFLLNYLGQDKCNQHVRDYLKKLSRFSKR